MTSLVLSGIARWAKVQKPDQKYKYYGIEVKLDEKSLAEFNASGITTVKPSKDGEGYYSFKRRPEQMVWKNKQQVRAGAPKVYDNHGNPSTDFIGNGSEVLVKVTTFPYDNDFGKGVSCRLEAVQIEKLVVYEEKKDYQDNTTPASFEDKPKLRIMF